MSFEDCAICEGNGHEGDTIWVRGKAFCPITFHRIWTEDEAEEMTEEELEVPKNIEKQLTMWTEHMEKAAKAQSEYVK